MDSLELVCAVKAEKAKALHRYKKLQRLKTLTLHALEASVALTLLLSMYSSPLSLAVDSAIDRSLKLLFILKKPLSAFLLSNAIIVTVAFLSRNNTNKITPNPPRSTEFSEIYDEYLSRRRSHLQAPSNMLQIVSYSPKPEKKAVEEKKKQHRRTRSTVAARTRLLTLPREAELQRSVTGNGRSSVNDDMSSEEFNRTVESYIERTRLLLQMETEADLTAENVLAADRAVVVRR